jgi:hypothetical protein
MKIVEIIEVVIFLAFASSLLWIVLGVIKNVPKAKKSKIRYAKGDKWTSVGQERA